MTLTTIVVVGVTGAYFSDEERSLGNTFEAGKVDLVVDSEQHYNGNVCMNIATSGDSIYQWQGDNPYPIPGTACTGTWESKDMTVENFFNFLDVKPGDWGENTISLTVHDNDSYLCAYVENLTNDDNGITEPESVAGDTTDGEGYGELQDYIHLKIWKDTNCDNVWQEGETVLVQNSTIDSNDGAFSLDQLVGNEKTCLGVAWNVPSDTGNIIQTDSVMADLRFYVEQVRHNPNFSCDGHQLPVTPPIPGDQEETPTPTETPNAQPELLTVNFTDLGANPQYGYTYDYSQADVSFQYLSPANPTLSGEITATGLKPYATYQIKFEGIPTCVDAGGNDTANEYIGYAGRWWNNDTDTNVNDTYYVTHPTECITGYLVWDFFTADNSGNATKNVYALNSYHVLWCNDGPCDTTGNTQLYTPDPVHTSLQFCPADKVFGEIERLNCEGLSLNSGTYDLNLVLTEESFHQGPGTWTTVMQTPITFELL